MEKIILALLAASVVFITGALLSPSDQRDTFAVQVNRQFYPGEEAKGFIISKSGSSVFSLKLFQVTDQSAFIRLMLGNEDDNRFEILSSPEAKDFLKPVRDWQTTITSPDIRYGREEFSLGVITDPGYYILQVVSDEKVAYTPVVVSRFAILTRMSGSQMVSVVSDVRTGEIHRSTDFRLYSKNKPERFTASDSSGIGIMDLDKDYAYNNRQVLTAQVREEIIYNNPYFWYMDTGEKFTGYIYTAQPIYRPGAKVQWKAILRQTIGNDILLPAEGSYDIKINSPKGKTVSEMTGKLTDAGSLFGEFTLDGEAELGIYYINISSGNKSVVGSFEVQEYKKPEYKVEISFKKTSYTKGEKMTGTVKADYYFGSPVTDGAVTVRLYKKNFYYPWWWWNENAWFYKGFDRYAYFWNSDPEFFAVVEGKLNSNGEYAFEYEAPSDNERDFQVQAVAEVTDASRRAIQGSGSTMVTRADFTITTAPVQYYTRKDEPISIKTKTFTFDGKPVQSKFIIIINKQNYTGGNTYEETVHKDTLSTDAAGMNTLTYTPKEGGYYTYIVTAKDQSGKEVSARGSFYVSDLSVKPIRDAEGTQIIAEKDVYNEGETMNAIIILPVTDVDVLITFERNKLIGTQVVRAKGNSVELSRVLTPDHAPGFRMNVLYLKDGVTYQKDVTIGVLPLSRFLSLSVSPDKKVYQPGDSAHYVITIRDQKGNPVSGAELSLGSVDESIYAIKPESVVDIKSHFYTPVFPYAVNLSSHNTYGFSGTGRDLTLFDYGFYNTDKEPAAGTSSIAGKVTITDAGNHFWFESENLKAEVLLAGKSSVFTSPVDTAGTYRIVNVPRGEYDLMVGLKEFGYKKIKRINIGQSEHLKEDIETEFQYYLFGGRRDRSYQSVDEMMVTSEEGAAPPVSISKSKDMKQENESNSPVVRTEFKDAAFFNPALISDANGNVKVSFKLPDNLTSWRATVRAVDKTTRVAQQTDIVIARKDIMIRLETPRFFRQNDTTTVSAIVHNYTGKDQYLRFKLRAIGLDYINEYLNNDPKDRPMTTVSGYTVLEIPAGGSVSVTQQLAVKDPIRSAEVYAEASIENGKPDDALRVTVPVLPAGIRMIDPVNLVLRAGEDGESIITIPEGVDLRSVNLSIGLQPSIAGALLKSLDDLVQYPYGCVEQTMSRFLPAVIAAGAFRELGLTPKSATLEKLPEVIEQGTKRLYGMQHEDGGWGWWKNDETNAYMTAYVVYGLTAAKKEGYDVDEAKLSAGAQRLLRFFNDKSQTDKTSAAYMGFALASAATGSEMKERAVSILDSLAKKNRSDFESALIGLGYLALGEKGKAKKLADLLLESADEDGRFFFWKASGKDYTWQHDGVQTTSFALKLLLSVRPEMDMRYSKAVNWLLLQQKGHSWVSTQQTATVIFALADYLKVTRELEPDLTYEVEVNGKTIRQGRFVKDDVTREHPAMKLTSADASLRHGKNIIKISGSGSGMLYVSGFAEYFVTDFTGSVQNGFTITRKYHKLTPVKENGTITYKKDAPKDIVSGDIIFVEISVKSRAGNAGYIMVEDMFPSGFEFVQDAEFYRVRGENTQPDYIGYRPWIWWYADREVRDEKVSFFVTYAQDEMRFTYMLRAQMPGSVTAPPAEASLMYYPDIRGLSTQASFTVSEEPKK
ncbi:Alpha-2-macroglobulin [uncultured bacterium]|nr:Alpha-2-macroglobulin [uncultured bacterium]